MGNDRVGGGNLEIFHCALVLSLKYLEEYPDWDVLTLGHMMLIFGNNMFHPVHLCNVVVAGKHSIVMNSLDHCTDCNTENMFT